MLSTLSKEEFWCLIVDNQLTDKDVDEVLQGLRLLDIVKNTTIDLTERERCLLDLLLKQSSDDKIVQPSRRET